MMDKIFWLLAAVCALSACTTTFDNSKVDYKSQGKQAPGLEVPPDLSLLTKNSQASVPVGGAANASTLQGSGAATLPAASPTTAVNALGDVRVVRDGSQRWLVTERAPEKLWEDIKKFWADNGLTIILDQPTLGIMETEWNENRAKLPQDGVRKYFGKLLNGLYSTNERDKYRTRLERTANGGSEIYISHRGMMEDYATNDRTTMIWKPRPSDPELEIEFLKRLMVRLGATQEAAHVALDQKPSSASTPTFTVRPPVRASIEQDSAQSSLVVTDELDLAWRRVGLSLDRANFTVEDRDRSKGIYYVRYVDPSADKNAPGFFARLMGAKAKDSLQKYQIMLVAQPSGTRIRVADTSGKVLNTAEAKSILKVLQDDLQ